MALFPVALEKRVGKVNPHTPTHVNMRRLSYEEKTSVGGRGENKNHARFPPREPLALINPNKAWVVEQVDKLTAEWRGWLEEASVLPVSPEYNPQTGAEVMMDGRANINRHGILREKTLTFLASNFTGYTFLLENWKPYPHEDNLSRRREVIPDWIRRMEVLAACIEYARVPDGYWTTRGKQLVEAIAGKAPDKMAEIATSFLKGG